MAMPRTVIHWFRRDLRLTDNTALGHAVKSAEQVVPVYILSGWKRAHGWTGPKRQQFLCGCLESLAKNLEAVGSRLILREGDAAQELEELIQETGAEAVFVNRDPDPHGKAMEKKIGAMCARLGVTLGAFKDVLLHEPDEVLTGEGKPYRVFTPYSRSWLALPKGAPHGRAKSLGPATKIASLPLPTLATWKLQADETRLVEAGERAARERMRSFVEGTGISLYKERRDLPAEESTSRLSQDLRFGLISIRELQARCVGAEKAHPAAKEAIQTYLKELAWREFYMAVLHHWPEVLEEEFNEEFRNLPWLSDEKALAAWKEGRTGFPIVDAGMRQLLATGFMHNRVRMIVSMFLTKDLHVHWRLGESHFMQHLVDGEIASNNGGWQWSAGTGADAAPYFRIQNPWTQTKRYDPEGAYIKAWVPELRGVNAELLMEPAQKPLHPDYPLPIVEHSAERERTLKWFKQARR
jgi:deoxyribodipyrimidine photo-lyase